MYAIDKIDFGITSKCNAGCPMCLRTNPDTNKAWDWLQQNDLTLEQIKKIVSPEFFERRLVKSISICGGQGDPFMNKEVYQILEYFIEHAKYAGIFIATNGSMGKKRPEWWHKIGKLLSKSKNQVRVTFAIDGVDHDQHIIYRVSTDFDTIIRNAQILQMYGIETEWQYIVFKHNQHDIDRARELAKKYNFSHFREVTNIRTSENGILPPDNIQEVKAARGAQFNRFQDIQEINSLDCISEKNADVHIQQNGYVIPCCYLEERFFYLRNLENMAKIHNVDPNNLPQNNELVQDINLLYANEDLEQFNAITHGLEKVLEGEWWDNAFLKNRDNMKINKCRDICGKCL
jgi:molybdenum cofactor biosynthesis enzyme MoaA